MSSRFRSGPLRHASVALSLAAAGLLASGTADASTERAHATLASDGTYTLVLKPARGWSEAEVTVADDGAQDVGPASDDAPVSLEGLVATTGPLRVTVHAATPDAAGYTWTFEVIPDPVPVALPVIVPDLEPETRPVWWPFGKR